MPFDPSKELKGLTGHGVAKEAIVGVLGVSLRIK